MKIQVNKQNVGLRIKQFRLNKGYTLGEFGKFFDTSDSIVSRWEKGKALPNKERIKAIAKFMDITVNELLYGSVEEFVREQYKKQVSFIHDDGSVHSGYDYGGATLLIDYIKEKNIHLDINNIEHILNVINNEVAPKYISGKISNIIPEFGDSGNIFYTRLSLAFMELTSNSRFILERTGNSDGLKLLSDKNKSEFLSFVELNIKKLNKIKENLEK